MVEPTSNPVVANPVIDTDQPRPPLDSLANGRPAWRRMVPLALVVAFSTLLRAGIVSVPLDRDEGEYAYIAQRWLAGELPYRDAFVQTPPGVFVAYTVLFALGGTSIEAIHWFGHAQFVGTLVFVYLIGRRLFSHVAGVVAALFTIILIMDPALLGSASSTELFAILPLAAGLFFALRAADDGRPRDALLAGLCGGLALCFKLVVVPVVLFYLVWIVVLRWRLRRVVQTAASPSGDLGQSAPAPIQARPALFRLVGSFVLGIGLVLVPTCLYFAGYGAWSDFLECVVRDGRATNRPPLHYYGTYLWGLTKVYWSVFAPILALAMFALRGAQPGGPLGVRACLGWWATLFLALHLSGYYREQYFVLIMPAVALLAAYGAESLAPILEPKRKQWQSRVATGLAVVAACWTLFQHGGFYRAPSPELVCRLLHARNPFPESIALGKLLRENSEPTDKIFICGSEPQILFYAERASASRYVVVYPLFSGTSAQSRQRSVIEEVRRSRPKFVILVLPNVVPASYAAAEGFPNDLMKELSELVNEDYSTFVAVTLRRDWTTRTIQPVMNENGKEGFMTEPEETVTLQVWERRDSSKYTDRQTNMERRMNPQRDKLRRNLDEVRQRIDRATQATGRPSDAVRLVAVTKQVDDSVASDLVELGVNDLGENRPQELWRKQQLVRGPVRWHLVGTLQKNKARRTLPLVHLIHSVDSAALVTRLDELAGELDMRLQVLLEVNVSGEATKHGFGANELFEVIAGSAGLARVQIRGLMTMAPYDDDPNRARPYFATLRELRDRLASQAPPNCRLTELSMGMSGDFEAAIAEGATIVRIGSALFEGIKEPA